MTPAEFRTIREDELQASQVQLAEILGVTRYTIMRWESGETPIPRTVHLAIKAVRAFGGEA